MKKSTGFIIGLLFLLPLFSEAQHYIRRNPYKWMMAVSWNVVEDSGEQLGGAFDVPRTWNYQYFPSQLSFTKNYWKKWSWEILGSYNKYNEGTRINLNDTTEGMFLSFDAHSHYSFAKHDLRRGKIAKFEPFIFAGLGLTYRQNTSYEVTGTINVGAGLNLFFTKSLGLQFRAIGKYGIGTQIWSPELNYMHYSAGIVYRALPKKGVQPKNNKPRHKWIKKGRGGRGGKGVL